MKELLRRAATKHRRKPSFVMAGLVPAIHVFVLRKREDVEARHKAGHDDVYGRESLRLARDHLADRGLRRRKARDRHAIGRARDIIEPDVVTERDGGGIAAVLAADTDLE